MILELSNPELEQSALEARLNLEAAEARCSTGRSKWSASCSTSGRRFATTGAQLKTARLQADADGQLFTQGLVSSLQLQQSQSAEQEYETRYALERERLQIATDTVDAQLAVEQAEVDRLRTLYELPPTASARHAPRSPPRLLPNPNLPRSGKHLACVHAKNCRRSGPPRRRQQVADLHVRGGMPASCSRCLSKKDSASPPARTSRGSVTPQC